MTNEAKNYILQFAGKGHSHPPTKLGVQIYYHSSSPEPPISGKRDMHTLYLGYRLPLAITKPVVYVLSGNISQTMPPMKQPPYCPSCNQVCVCVCGGGGGGSHALWGVCLLTFEPFRQRFNLGQSELGNSSRKPIGSGWRKVKSAWGGGGELSICMRNTDLLDDFSS